MQTRALTMTTLTLWCGVYDDGDPFSIQINRDADVEALKKAIFRSERYDKRFPCSSPAQLKLYTTQTGGTWLKGSDFEEVLGREGVETMFTKMVPWSALSNYFDEAFESKCGDIHVLVELPLTEERVTKRQRLAVGRETSLAQLWTQMTWKPDELPPPHELQELLLQRLPFKFKLKGTVENTELFSSGAPQIDCSTASQWMDYYGDLCKITPSCRDSRRSWLLHYATLLQIPIHLSRASGLLLQEIRLADDVQEWTAPIKRPDCFVTYNGVVLLRGEERGEYVSTSETLDQVTATMDQWNVRLYGDLPYIVTYATTGSTLELALLERVGVSVRYTPILTLDIVAQKEVALKVFFNLAALLRTMALKAQRPDGWFLDPLMRHDTEKRTLVLLDTVVIRVVTREQRRDAEDFLRLVDVYTALMALNSPARIQVPYLQTVHRLVKEREVIDDWESSETSDEREKSEDSEEGQRLVVHLSPVGYPRRPDVHEVSQWLENLLTGLKHWHERGYCHGDVHWRNIVFVPSVQYSAPHTGHWMLIDMDKSYQHGKVVITWTHPCEGELLGFQHDLFQLGSLMETLWFELPETVMYAKQLLLDAASNPEATATAALTLIL